MASNGCKEGMTLPRNVVHIGSVKEKEVLAKMYSAADLCIITSQKETFSMVCAESLCCGTPVVGFKAGAPEVISIPEYSEFADFGDVQTLGEITEKWVDFKKDNEGISEVISSRAIGLYSKEIMTDKYISIYKKLLGE